MHLVARKRRTHARSILARSIHTRSIHTRSILARSISGRPTERRIQAKEHTRHFPQSFIARHDSLHIEQHQSCDRARQALYSIRIAYAPAKHLVAATHAKHPPAVTHMRQDVN